MKAANALGLAELSELSDADLRALRDDYGDSITRIEAHIATMGASPGRSAALGSYRRAVGQIITLLATTEADT